MYAKRVKSAACGPLKNAALFALSDKKITRLNGLVIGLQFCRTRMESSRTASSLANAAVIGWLCRML